MKRLIAVATVMLVVAGFLSTERAEARTMAPAHFVTVQYLVPPVPVMTVCYVNGVNYQVDYQSRIWTLGPGGWFIIGRIAVLADGTTIAIRTDGLRFPAACN